MAGVMDERTPAELAAGLRASAQAIVSASVAAQYEAEPAWERYGEAGRRKALADAAENLSYLLSAFELDEPKLLADYGAWLSSLFEGLGLPPGAAEASLYALADAAGSAMGPAAGAALRAFIGVAAKARVATAAAAGTGGPGPLAEPYLARLLAGDRKGAIAYVEGLRRGGMAIKRIYLDVFAPAQRELGWLWQSNRISVAQEHYGTAVTQLAMAGLYPELFSGARRGRSMAAACVGGELHELGIRMVADFFEMEGWDSRYYGANAPGRDLARSLAAEPPDLLCLSATLSVNVRALAETVAAVRAEPALAGLPIIVGGRPFAVAPGLWKEVGADGTAASAEEALALADELVGAAR